MARIIFVLTYPAYHSVGDPEEWLGWDNRDRRMPALLAALGVDVELWAVGIDTAEHVSAARFGAPYRIRLFARTGGGAKSRDHYSDEMIAAARSDPADLFVLIGTNGGAGYRLFDRVLRPDRRPFALIIGGDYWSRLVPHARLLFTECALQEQALARGGWLRPRIPRARMERLPKTIDTALFRPGDGTPRWDVLSVSRVTRWKSFSETGTLSRTHRVAVAGGGPDAAKMERRHPAIDWLGHRRHAEIPQLLAQTRIYFHAGRRDYFPRAIVEAMACGRPVLGFADRLGADVIPPECGLRVTERDFRPLVAALLNDPARIDSMGVAARAHVVATHGLRSSEAACHTLLRLVDTGS